MNRIKLLSVRNIYLTERDIEPKENTDYELVLVVSRNSVEYLDTFGESGVPDKIFKMKVSHPEMLKEIGSHKEIKIQKGYSKSQMLRFALLDWLKRTGKEPDEKNYENQMDKLIKFFNEKDI